MDTLDNTMKERQMASTDANKSTTGLLSTLADDVTGLIRSELKLAKSEVNESVSDVKTGVVSLAIGAAILVPGVTLLIASIVMMVEAFTGLSMWSSTLLVGAIVTTIGAVLLTSAKSKLSVDNVMPSRTQSALQKDANLVERKLS